MTSMRSAPVVIASIVALSCLCLLPFSASSHLFGDNLHSATADDLHSATQGNDVGIRLYPSTRLEFVTEALQGDRLLSNPAIGLYEPYDAREQTEGKVSHSMSPLASRMAVASTASLSTQDTPVGEKAPPESSRGSAGQKADGSDQPAPELAVPSAEEMMPEAEAEKEATPGPNSTADEQGKKEEEKGEKGPSEGDDSAKDADEADAHNSDASGNPLAAGIIRLLRPEVEQQFAERGVKAKFEQWRSYAASRLNATAGPYSGSEINGLARLAWFDKLLRDPLRGPVEAEAFTRELHAGFRLATANGIRQSLGLARPRMDLTANPAPNGWDTPRTGEEAVEQVHKILLQAAAELARAIKPLEQAELSDLARNSYSILTTGTSVGHTINSRGSGVRLCRLMGKMDRAAWFDLAETLAQTADPALLAALAEYSHQGGSTVSHPGVDGDVVAVQETTAGTIIVGGKGNNVYRLEEMKKVAAVIDLGGNDVYLEGAVNISRPLLIVIDLNGEDRYQGSQPGIQGGAILGGSVLVDVGGNDVYSARDVAQGSALVGVGMLIDLAGSDKYLGFRRVQGQAIGGVGLLLDREGQDDYRAAMWGQGFAGPWGFATIEDAAGHDHYYLGGYFYDSYPETPGYDGWGQGVSAGIRGVANGGVGVLLEGDGDDEYEFDYFAQGGGYWLGLGFARDFAGNDKRLGATRNAYNGSARTQQRFQRFGNGWACHYAVGFLIDDLGNDSYDGSIMGTGFGWDLSAGFLLELDGNDQYLARVGGVQGQGAQASLGILYDFAGGDLYNGTSQGYASGSITYHPYPTCGGNFSFVVDYGGTDQYGSRAKNNSVSRRGSFGGFIVDRPKKEELEAMQAAVP